MKKDTIKNMQKIAEKRGGKCLSDNYINNSSKLLWECKNGHQWLNTPSHIKDGQWCKICGGLKKLNIGEMQKIAKKKGGVCLSKKYINIDTKLSWQCSKGHIWEATPYSVKSGTWCPKCAGRILPTINELNEFAKKKGGVCLSKNHINSKIKLKWKCSKGHRWETTVYSILKQKTWCPICAGNTPRNITHLHKIAKERGGKCLSEKYINVGTKYKWECSLGHMFINSFNKVSNGQWCPTCSKSGISEEICREVFKQIFKDDFPKHRPSWLKNDRGFQMEIDGYSKKLKIGFEYHGVQHFEKTGIYTKTDDLLKKRINDDKLKTALCKKHDVKLFILTYHTPYWEFSKEIKKQYKNFKLNLSNVEFSKEINISNAYIRRDRIIELRELLKFKQIQLLSSKWLGTNEKYKLKCLVCNSVWEARGNAFFNQRRVSGCDYCNRRVPANVGTIQDVIDFANKFDGKVISTKYIGRRANYEFLCKNGHKFTKNFNNMKFRNQWCPVCEKRHIQIKNK